MKVAAVFDTLIKAAPVRMWALIGAGPIATLIQLGLIWIIWRGGWPPTLAGEQLRYLGILAFGNTAIIAVIVVALAAARVKGQGPGGTSLEIDSGADPPPTGKITVTTTAETKTT